MIISKSLLLACLVFSPLPGASLLFPLSFVLILFSDSILGVVVAFLAKTHQTRHMTLFMSLVIPPCLFSVVLLLFLSHFILFLSPQSYRLLMAYAVSMALSIHPDNLWNCILHPLFCSSQKSHQMSTYPTNKTSKA